MAENLTIDAVKPQLEAETQELAEALAELQTVTITNREELAVYESVLVDVHAKAKAIESLKTSITKPINAALAAARKLFAPTEEKLRMVENAIKNAIAEYQDRIEAMREEAQDDLRAATSLGEHNHALSQLSELDGAEKTNATISKATWTFEIINEEEVPRQYLKVNEQAIRAAIAQGVREIPGVSIHLKRQIAMKPTKAK